MGSRVGRSHHSIRRDDRRDVGAATRLATTRAASRYDPCSRAECRTDREAVRDPISDRSPEREAVRDRGAVDLRAAIHDREAVSDAGAQRGAIEDTGTHVRTRGRSRVFEHRRGCADVLRNRIEDGELVDSYVRIDVRRWADTSAFADSKRPASAIDLTGSIAVHDTRAIAFRDARAIAFRDARAIALRDT